MAATVQKLDLGQRKGDAQTVPAEGLRQLVRERLALSDEPDPHTLAGEIASELPERFVREVVRAGLVAMLREEIRSGRRRRPVGPRHSAEMNAAAALMWDVYSQRFQSADGWKLFGDFTREDAQWNAERYRIRAAEQESWAERFEKLAKALTRGRTVREALSREDAAAVLNV